jgi:ubiquinone/menaquinone biosynthesis C-methylase UbiE
MRGASPWWRLVRFGFRLLYNEFAFTYDVVSRVVSLGAWRCWQRSTLKHIYADGLVLELAHGTGDLQLDLNSAGHKTIGYDLSPHMGRLARRKLLRHGIDPRLTRGAAQALPFRDEQFTSVVSTFPSEFIIAPETLREVWRVLADSGVLVIVPGATFSGGGAAKALLEWLYKITGQRQPEADLSGQYEAWFAGYGFQVEVRQEPCPHSVALVIIARKDAMVSP